MIRMTPTFQTKDFDVFLFDKNDTGLHDVIKISVEDLVATHRDTDRKIAFISSANSLGFMDGGSDLGYMKAINGIQTFVQNGIKELGYLTNLGRPHLYIGDTMGFELPSNANILFISAPTMFLPQNVKGSDNQYVALKSALQICKACGVEQVYTPMMCTNWGGYDYNTSYNLMKKAVQDYNEAITSKIRRNGKYIYNITSEATKKEILSKQPKVYMNTEFGISNFDVMNEISKRTRP